MLLAPAMATPSFENKGPGKQVAARINEDLRWKGFTDKICLSIAAQILAAAALFSAANIVSILMCVLEAQVRSVLKESAYCRMSSL